MRNMIFMVVIILLMSVLSLLVPISAPFPTANAESSGLSRNSHWFQSVEDAQSWLDAHPVPVKLYAIDNEIVFNNNPDDPRWDCDDMANWLVDEAEKDGYRLMEAPVSTYGYIFGDIYVGPVSKWPDKHVGVWTRIGNAYWYIEPQTRNMTYLVRVD